MLRVLECVAQGTNTVAGVRLPELPTDMLDAAAAASAEGSYLRQGAFMRHMQGCLKVMGLLQDMG